MNYRVVQCPAFEITGQKTWISGPDNEQFGRFWRQCQEGGLFAEFERLGAFRPGPRTGGVTLGVSCVQADPANRAFDYWIAIEKPAGCPATDLETFAIPAGQWAVFECAGPFPESIVAAEMFAFQEWLPASGMRHAPAPEMEVYPPDRGEPYCEFWLPIEPIEEFPASRAL